MPACPDWQVAAAAFDLLFAFDEVISLGHKENVTAAQVRAGAEPGAGASAGLERAGRRWLVLGGRERALRRAAPPAPRASPGCAVLGGCGG